MFRDDGLAVAEATGQDGSREVADSHPERQGRTHSTELTKGGLRIAPGKEKEFRHVQSWLAVSDRLDQLIEATDTSGERERVRAAPPVVAATAQRAETSRKAALPRRPAAGAPTGGRPVVGGLARRAGQALRRIGEALEAWGSVPPAEAADTP